MICNNKILTGFSFFHFEIKKYHINEIKNSKLLYILLAKIHHIAFYWAFAIKVWSEKKGIYLRFLKIARPCIFLCRYFNVSYNKMHKNHKNIQIKMYVFHCDTKNCHKTKILHLHRHFSFSA